MGKLGELVLRLFATGRLSESRIEFDSGIGANGRDILGISGGKVLFAGGNEMPIRDIRRVWLKGKKNIRK